MFLGTQSDKDLLQSGVASQKQFQLTFSALANLELFCNFCLRKLNWSDLRMKD